MCGAIRKHGSLRGYCREACPISSGNFLLPLLVGGPDMAKGFGPHPTGLAGVGKNLSNKISSTSSLPLNSCNLGSYLAGLFEGDGHI